MNIKIRSASTYDASFLAWVILISGRAHVQRGIWEVILGGGEQECLTFLQSLTITQTPHLFHHSCFLIAEVGGRSAAALGGYDPRSLGYLTLRKAIEEIAHKRGSSGLDPGAMKRSKGVLSCIPEDVEGAWVVESVATVPEFRRQGITSKLLEEMLERGRSLGFRRAQINIYIGNMPAQRLYEKYGFQIMDEKRNPDFEKEIGSPGMARLLCNL